MSPPVHGTDMHRRTLFRTVPLLALAGCTGAGGGDRAPRITDRAFRDTGGCSHPETATVDASTTTVRIGGCITGPNGCSVARLNSAAVEGDTLAVVVGTGRDAPQNVACTEALVQRGYAATITLDGRVSGVRVVHDAPGGRETVVDTSGGGGEDTAHDLA